MLPVHHISDGLFKLLRPDFVPVVKFLVVDAGLAAQIHGDLAFLVGSCDAENPFVPQFGQILADGEADSSRNRGDNDIHVLLGLVLGGPGVNNFEGDDLSLYGPV